MKQSLDYLTIFYQSWLNEQELPMISADELLASHEVSPDQIEWLEAFQKMWELSA